MSNILYILSIQNLLTFIEMTMENTLATQKKEQLYTKLVEDFMKNQKIKASDEEKKKFLMLCLVNELNPWKKEVYAIPYGDKLTLVIWYNVFLQRAEATWLVAGWNILMRKVEWKLISWTITIYRKDWTKPFEYSLDLVDAKNDKNPLWNTKAEDMLRKQLIRIWFGLAFPQIAPVSDPEDITEPQLYHEIEKWAKVPLSTPISVIPEEKDISEARTFIDFLFSYLPDDYIPEGFSDLDVGNWEDADVMIKALQVEIWRRFIKDKTLLLEKSDIKTIFVGDDINVVAMKKEAIKLLPKENE